MNAKVISNSMAVVTTITLDQIKKLEAEKPAALCVYEGEGKEKKEVFRVSAGNNGCVKAIGITFDSSTNTEDKLACVTVDLSGKPEDMNVKEYAAKKYGKALKYLAALEAGFKPALDEADAEAAALRELIKVEL